MNKYRDDDWKWSEARTTALQDIENLLDSGKEVLALVPDLFSGHADYIRMGGAMRGVYVLTMGTGGFFDAVFQSHRFDYIVFDNGMDRIKILPVESEEGRAWFHS